MKSLGFGFFVLSAILAGCIQRGPLTDSTQERRIDKIQQAEGERTSADDFQPISPETQAVIESKPRPTLGLILSAGGARAMAHAGVLKALEEKRVHVHAIVGHEWGALPGALFSDLGRSHQVEWGLFKLKNDAWNPSSLLKKFLKSNADQLRDYLVTSLPRRNIELFEVKFSCPTINIQTGQLLLRDRGQPQTVLQDCMSITPTLDLRMWSASPLAMSESVEWLKEQGATLIVLINVIADGPLWKNGESPDSQVALQWFEIRNSLNRKVAGIETKSLRLKGFYLNQFSAKNEMINVGYEQGLELAKDLIENRGF